MLCNAFTERYNDSPRPSRSCPLWQVKALGRLVRAPAHQNGSSHKQNGANGAITSAKAYEAAKSTMVRFLCPSPPGAQRE